MERVTQVQWRQCRLLLTVPLHQHPLRPRISPTRVDHDISNCLIGSPPPPLPPPLPPPPPPLSSSSSSSSFSFSFSLSSPALSQMSPISTAINTRWRAKHLVRRCCRQRIERHLKWIGLYNPAPSLPLSLPLSSLSPPSPLPPPGSEDVKTEEMHFLNELQHHIQVKSCNQSRKTKQCFFVSQGTYHPRPWVYCTYFFFVSFTGSYPPGDIEKENAKKILHPRKQLRNLIPPPTPLSLSPPPPPPLPLNISDVKYWTFFY